jgi:hypothetical protein
MRFDENTFLSGRIGKGQVQIRPENAKSFAFSNKNGLCTVSVVTTNGDSIALVVDAGVLLSGDTDLGRYAIPLTQVTRITPGDDSQT